MSLKSNNKARQKADLSNDYKLVVYRSEDLREVRSFNLSLGNVYILTSIVFLLLCILLFSLLAFTPLKRLVPGYGKLESNQKFLELIDGVDDLSIKIEAQGTYIEALRTLLSTGLADPGMDQFIDADTQKGSDQLLAGLSGQQNELIIPFHDKSRPFESIPEEELYATLANNKVFNPVNGIVSSEFDPGIKHYGVDILAPSSTPIMSIMDGIVFSSGWDLETGYTIGIQHSDNILSFYKHNSQLLKEKGTFVRAGEAVAIIGNTGTLSSGPHLHFEIWHNGKPINPQDILNIN